MLEASSESIGVPILCRISFNKINISNISSLLQQISENDKANLIKPYFAHVTQTHDQREKDCSFCGQNVFNNEEDLINHYTFLFNELFKYGFEYDSFFVYGRCMFPVIDSCVISPDGKIYKCLDMVGIDELNVGDVATPIHYNNNYYKIISDRRIEKCFDTDCPFIPLCGGGCVLEPLLQCGNYNDVICHRDLFDAVNNTLLRLRYGS